MEMKKTPGKIQSSTDETNNKRKINKQVKLNKKIKHGLHIFVLFCRDSSWGSKPGL